MNPPNEVATGRKVTRERKQKVATAFNVLGAVVRDSRGIYWTVAHVDDDADNNAMVVEFKRTYPPTRKNES